MDRNYALESIANFISAEILPLFVQKLNLPRIHYTAKLSNSAGKATFLKKVQIFIFML
jgi:hypothetical protein